MCVRVSLCVSVCVHRTSSHRGHFRQNNAVQTVSTPYAVAAGRKAPISPTAPHATGSSPQLSLRGKGLRSGSGDVSERSDSRSMSPRVERGGSDLSLRSSADYPSDSSDYEGGMSSDATATSMRSDGALARRRLPRQVGR